MTDPKNFTDYLTKLTVSAATARDLGYVHTGCVLDRLAEAEKSRLRSSLRDQKSKVPSFAQTSKA